MKLKNLFEFVFCICLLVIITSSCKNKDANSENANEESRIKKQNIVFILADDLGVNDLSFAGSKYYETPSIDRIASEGVVFNQGYAACQVCSPSRASIMTGQSAARHGITDWIGAATGEIWGNKRNTKILPPEYKHSLDDNSTTIAEALKQGGYKTFFAGKWHLGEAPSSPENNGFDVNKGGWEVGSPKGGFYAPWENPKLIAKHDGESLTMRLAQETADFITQNKDTTFFAFLSFYAVHAPIQTTEDKWRKYRNKAEKQGIPDSGFEMERVLPIRNVQDNPIYAGLVETMDDAVGLVLNKLEELGLDENTIIVFTSDNGGVASGDAFSTSNLPLRGGKGYQWEGGIREPYIIKAPSLKNTPKSIDYPVSGIDFYPTLLDLVDVETKPTQVIDGVSLLPLLKGESLENRALFWHYPHYGNQGGEPASIIRRNEWKLIHYYEDGRDELYNLTYDSAEKQDVIKENMDLAKKLRTELDTYLQSVHANTPIENLNYNKALAKKQDENRRTKLLQNLEKQRKTFLNEDFDPGNNWYDSKLTID
jgi:arylsulfatase A-like enzyme